MKDHVTKYKYTVSVFFFRVKDPSVRTGIYTSAKCAGYCFHLPRRPRITLKMPISMNCRGQLKWDT
jgi:hypothetical protein